jgi:signal transduction histidine kinase
MTLAKRLVAGALLLVGLLGVVVLLIIDARLYARFEHETALSLDREARLIALQWRPTVSPDPLADSAGRVLGHRVTLVAADGTVLGDSEFDEPALSQLENHASASRPEILGALKEGAGCARRTSASAGDEEFYCAVRTAAGVVRVSVPTTTLDAIFGQARRDVIFAIAVAMAAAILLAMVFSRAVSRPIVRLRDVARGLADGDLSRRPSLAAPAEVGELAVAIHRLAEQLGTRLAALQTEQALLGAVVDSLNEGVVVVATAGTVVRINAAGRALLGVRATQPPPFSTDLLPRDKMLRDALRAALDGHSTEGIEIDVDGHTLALTARPLPSVGAVLALFDLTALRRLENVRRDFVANVSHELRTPLTVIGGFAETLAEVDSPAATRREFAEKIRTSATRMQRMVDDLLDLARIESGGWTPRPARVDLADVASEAFAAVQPSAASTISLSADIAPDARTILADPTALRQIVGNLLQNAVRHTAAGSVTVFAVRESGGVRIGVRDTGSGIAAEHIPRIFERFYRADAGRTREEGGTGLGLAIVKHLAEAHGGSVHAESIVGRGTTVSVFLPLERS